MDSNLRNRGLEPRARPVKTSSDPLLIVDALGRPRGVVESPRTVCACNRPVVEPVGPRAVGLCAMCPFRS